LCTQSYAALSNNFTIFDWTWQNRIFFQILVCTLHGQMYFLAKFQLHMSLCFGVTALQSTWNRKLNLYVRYYSDKCLVFPSTFISDGVFSFVQETMQMHFIPSLLHIKNEWELMLSAMVDKIKLLVDYIETTRVYSPSMSVSLLEIHVLWLWNIHSSKLKAFDIHVLLLLKNFIKITYES